MGEVPYDGSERESTRRRRSVVDDLLARFHPVALHDLADRLHAWERAEGDGDRTYEEVYRSLRVDHVPHLREAGILGAVEGPTEREAYSLTEFGLSVAARADD